MLNMNLFHHKAGLQWLQLEKARLGDCDDWKNTLRQAVG